MKRLVLAAAVLAAALTASTPAGACAAGPDGNPCFHDPYLATVTGSIWVDTDLDGAQSASEQPVGGVVWVDYDHNGKRDEGEPEVEAERDGSYVIPVDTRRGAQADLRVRFKDAPDPSSPYAAMCLAPAQGCARTLEVAAGKRVDDVRFPLATVAEIHGMIWDDRNDDGKRQAGEDGAERLHVFLDDNGNGKREPSEPMSPNTVKDGRYIFPVPTRYQAAGGALPPLVLEQIPGADCSAPDDCAITGLHTRSAQSITAAHGVARPVVIFIHGYGGAKIGCPGKDLWFSLPLPRVDQMRLDSDDPCARASGPTGLLMDVGGGDIYGGASRHFEDITWPGRHFDYVWDWRKSPADAVAGLDELVEKARKDIGVSRVQFVAHSMGGLVVREYLDDAARAEKVQRVVTVGTPYWGSPKVIFPIAAGTEVPWFSMMDVFIVNDWLKAATRSFPGHFALFPSSRAYGPWLKVNGRSLDVDGIANYMRDLHVKPALFLDGQSEHARVLDHYDDHGVDYEVIVGGGEPTPGSIAITHYPFGGGTFEVDWVSGDETVPAVSGAHDTPSDHLHYVCGISHVPLTTAEPTTRLVDPFIIRGEPMDDLNDAPCSMDAKESTVYHPDSLSTLALPAQAGEPRVIAGGRSYTLKDAEAAGVVQVLTLGSETKIVGPPDVRVEAPRGTAMAVRTLSDKGAGPEQRYLDGKRVQKDTKPPKTTAKWRGGKLVLHAKGAKATFVVVKGKPRRYSKPLKVKRGTQFFSVDAWGNAEKPRRA